MLASLAYWMLPLIVPGRLAHTDDRGAMAPKPSKHASHMSRPQGPIVATAANVGGGHGEIACANPAAGYNHSK
jgi:hypothetical protein